MGTRASPAKCLKTDNKIKEGPHWRPSFFELGYLNETMDRQSACILQRTPSSYLPRNKRGAFDPMRTHWL